MTELQAIYDGKQSFYGKAYTKTEGENKNLYSYGAIVAVISYNESSKVARVLDTHSQTTLRHIKEFLKQEGFKAETKRQIENDYMNF